MSHPASTLVSMWLGGWNPWRALRGRPHLRLVWALLPDIPGRLEDDGIERRVVIDARLSRRDRNAVLAHELIHDERGLLFEVDTPALLVAKEEAAVEREVARRLVPLDQLDAWVQARVELGEAVTAADVAEVWDVPAEVGQRALWLLRQQGACGDYLHISP